MCASISKQEYGFRYALLVWQMCLKFKVRPNLYMYELLLRAAKDCSLCSSKELIRLKKEPIQVETIAAKQSDLIAGQVSADKNIETLGMEDTKSQEATSDFK